MALTGVGQNQRLAASQEVEGFTAGVEIPCERVGRLRSVEDRCRSHRKEATKCCIG